ncbi:MAG: biopolymer transporter ExbD [Ekhidna sp.]|nr:biopolymer transporter ExbD [Ekhidna sp.]MBC6410801.1 biopolymer transporter ExbD [Ekhidna sp.]MBC6427575.1 biopolymer transporter ExbD [Ekhidna sp.]
MSKFKKNSKASQEIPTAALPDIIFMLLFFFMVTTVMREQEILVKQILPKAEQLSKIQKKSLVSHIYIGEPKNIGIYGEEPKIQTNDVFVEPDELTLFVNQEKDKLSEAERDRITMALNIDSEVKMGIVSDVEQTLRKSNARKLLYKSLKSVKD